MNRNSFIALIALITIGATAFSQSTFRVPIDSVASYKKITNIYWKGDSLWIGGSVRNQVTVTITNESPIDTLLVCGGNDTTRRAWLRLPPNGAGTFPSSYTSQPIPYLFLRRKVLTATDSVQTGTTSTWVSPP